MTEPILIPLGRTSEPQALVGRVVRAFNVYWFLLLLFITIAITAPLIAPYDPLRADLSSQSLPPSTAHWFGTDVNGMDVFSRVLWATRTDFAMAISGVMLGIAIGVPLGATGGYSGGFLDDLLNRVFEMLQSLPLLLFALMVFAALGNSHAILIGVIAFANAPKFFKLTRSVALPLRSSDYIAAARCAGLTAPGIIVRHVMPNSLGPVVSQFAIQCAYAIQIVAALSFLGFGVAIPHPEWGSMIQVGAGRIIYGEWWAAGFPGLAVMLAVVCLSGIGRQLGRWYVR